MLNVVWIHMQQALDSLLNFEDIAVKKLQALLKLRNPYLRCGSSNRCAFSHAMNDV